ncbi:GNAT family N-acetyltransferase [Candidatus Micrarchaeota archaeon]|nr:GNAT family N-acetyltransferase [Candidatus Micrarchaeota archaeon]
MITIKTVKPAELDTAKDFIREVFPDAMVQVADDDLLLLAEEDGRAIGFAHIIEFDDRVVLQGIGVDSSIRGQGVGTLLLEQVLSMFEDADRSIYLKVKAMNPAIDLYARYGFFLKKFGDAHVLVKKPNS